MTPTRPLSREDLLAYLVEALERATRTYEGRPPTDPVRQLALGEALALFRLADEFGLISDLRAQVDQRTGRDTYRYFSEAMRAQFGLGPERPHRGPPARRPPRRPGDGR